MRQLAGGQLRATRQAEQQRVLRVAQLVRPATLARPQPAHGRHRALERRAEGGDRMGPDGAHTGTASTSREAGSAAIRCARARRSVTIRITAGPMPAKVSAAEAQ